MQERLDQEELLHLAMEASMKQRHGDAIDYLKQSIAQSDQNAKALFLLAAAHAQIGLTQRAIEEYRRALEIEPSLGAARFQLGLLFLVNARVNEALETWQPFETAPATDCYAVFARGLTKLARNDIAASVDDLKQGLQISPVNPALNADIKRLVDQVEAHIARGGSPPSAAQQSQPGQILLSAYTKALG